MSRPTSGVGQREARATPMAPTTTASEVKPSVRACSPSATSAAEPIRRADADAVDGDEFVAEEPDQAGGDHEARW